VFDKSGKVTYWFYVFLNGPCLTDRSKKGPLKALDLKTVFSDFCGRSLICEMILVLVSLWLLVNWSKETSKEKRPIDFFYYFIRKYFDYFIIILPFFQFKRGYCMNDRLDFILTVIKRYYNSNDRLKFILLFIRWENDLNKWLKHVKKGYGKQTKWK